MRRREFITLVGGAAAAWPFSLRAQEAGRTYRIGGMSPSPRSARYNAVVLDEVRRFGFIEGQNLKIDWLGYGLNIDPVPEFAAKLVKPGSTGWREFGHSRRAAGDNNDSDPRGWATPICNELPEAAVIRDRCGSEN